MKRLRFVVPVVLVVTLVLTALVSAQALDPGSGSVNFTVQNLDPAESASVVAAYVNQSGQVDASRDVEIEPQSSAGFNIADSGLADNWQGSVIVSGDKEIVAFAQARWENGTHGDGKTAGAYNGFTAGANALYFPSLAARDEKQFSRLSIQSAEGASESETIDITVNLYDREGNLDETISDSLLKGTQVTYDLLTVDPGDGAEWLGAAVVTSDDPIAGVATMHWQNYSGAYSGVTGGGTTAYLPSITRRIKNAAWFQYTAVLVQNLSTDTAANVTVSWYDRDGVELYNFTDTIPANSSHGYNTRWTTSDVPDHAALHTALGEDYNGSVVVESNTDVVAIANLQWTADSPVGNAATAYASEPSGYEEIFVPANFRRVGTDLVWKQFTGLIVQNVGSSSCDDFGVEWRDREGTLLLNYTDTLTETGQSHGYNSRYGGGPMGDSSVLGDDFRGSVYIDAAGCELIAIHNTLWPLWTDSTTYNAFGK